MGGKLDSKCVKREKNHNADLYLRKNYYDEIKFEFFFIYPSVGYKTDEVNSDFEYIPSYFLAYFFHCRLNEPPYGTATHS